MNGHVYRQLILTCAGNNFLRGGDVSGLWPEADAYRFDKVCEFRTPPASGIEKDDFPLVAVDPVQWLAKMKKEAVGLRLHHTKRVRGPDQQLDVSDRMLAGMVGGGERWLVEVVGRERSEFWEGFERVGDQKDPERRVWLFTNIRVANVSRKDADRDTLKLSLDEAVRNLRAALVEIEAYARVEKYENFADIFRGAIAALGMDAREAPAEWPDARFAGLGSRQLMVLTALSAASVFGGMGSWNDLSGGEAYDNVSEALYCTLNDCTVALANSTFRG